MNSEMAVLGSLILDIDSMEKIAPFITEECFSETKNRIVFRTLNTMYHGGIAVDLLTISEQINKDGNQHIVTNSYIAMLTSAIPTAANIEYYAAEVREAYIRKRMREIGITLAESADDKTKNTDALIEMAEKKVFELNEAQTGQYTHISVPLLPAVELIEKYRDARGKYLGIPCGLSAVDDITSGFQEEDLIVVGARASIGKTAFALTMAGNIAKERPVGFFSLEMSGKQIALRLISMYGRIPNMKIRTGKMDHVDFNRMTDAGDFICSGKMFIYDKANASITDIKAKARRMRKRDGVEIIFVDYIGLITPENRELPRHEQISSICKELKGLARELKIPIIGLAQINRMGEGKKPCLAELKDSGSLEEDADIVMLLHRERENQDNDKLTDLIIAKHRNGPTGNINLWFVSDITKFETYDWKSEKQ